MVITGVIRPPPEIRAVVDRTALYVAKNGRAFEARILSSDKGKTPKFAFLHSTSPFHAYYEDRIEHYTNGQEEDEGDSAKGKEKTSTDQDGKQINDKSDNNNKNNIKSETNNETQEVEASKRSNLKISIVDPIAKSLLTQQQKIEKIRAEIEKAAATDNNNNDGIHSGQHGHVNATMSVPPPPPLHFVTLHAPATLSAAQLETIQLVAQFTAIDVLATSSAGTFLATLIHQEWNNPLFAFCQPRHAHFAYFSALVDAYKRILDQWRVPPSNSVTNNNNNKNKIQNSNTTNGTVNGTIEKNSHSNGIDDGDNIDAVQACLDEAAYRAAYMRDAQQQAYKNANAKTVSQIDWHDFVIVETIDFAVDEKVEFGMFPPPLPPPLATVNNEISAFNQANNVQFEISNNDDDDMERSDADDNDDDEDDAPIRVVPNYQPRLGTAKVDTSSMMVVDPITGKTIAVQDMPEHMRIQLLDPKWAEERKKFQEKQKESNLVGDDVVAANLARFTQARGDMFGHKERETLDDNEVKKRLEDANKIIHNSQNTPPGSTPSVLTAPPPYTNMHHNAPPPDVRTMPPMKKARIDDNNAIPAQAASTAMSQTITPLVKPAATLPPPVEAPEDLFAAAATATTSNQPSDGSGLIPAAQFAASLSKPDVTLQIRIPNDSTQMAWNFYGQIVSISVAVMSTVKLVKEMISKAHLNGMPSNKIQLKSVTTGLFLKDNLTLAALNIGPTATLELVPKVRGGRR